MSENHGLDIFERELESRLEELRACQQAKGLLPSESSPQAPGCLGCSEIDECQLRRDYVKSVYQSMNKGQGGDFAF